jgi:hypothetical protein
VLGAFSVAPNLAFLGGWGAPIFSATAFIFLFLGWVSATDLRILGWDDYR